MELGVEITPIGPLIGVLRIVVRRPRIAPPVPPPLSPPLSPPPPTTTIPLRPFSQREGPVILVHVVIFVHVVLIHPVVLLPPLCCLVLEDVPRVRHLRRVRLRLGFFSEALNLSRLTPALPAPPLLAAAGSKAVRVATAPRAVGGRVGHRIVVMRIDAVQRPLLLLAEGMQEAPVVSPAAAAPAGGRTVLLLRGRLNLFVVLFVIAAGEQGRRHRTAHAVQDVEGIRGGRFLRPSS